MSDQAWKDAAAQQRIVNHMQADHHDSVVRYLEHYHKLSSWTAHAGAITAVDLNGMTFSCGGKTYTIPFESPLSSYREARERVVAMDQECLTGLDRSDITIQEFPPLTTSFALEMAIPTFAFLAYSQRWWFEPRGTVAGVLGEGFANFSWVIQPWLLAFISFMHLWELAYFVYSRLRKHSVNPRTDVYWKWFIAQLLAGFRSYQRFDGMVAKKREGKMKQKH